MVSRVVAKVTSSGLLVVTCVIVWMLGMVEMEPSEVGEEESKGFDGGGEDSEVFRVSLSCLSSSLLLVMEVEVELEKDVVVAEVEGLEVKYESEGAVESGLSFFCSFNPFALFPSPALLSGLSTSFFLSPPLSSSPAKFSVLFSVFLKKSESLTSPCFLSRVIIFSSFSLSSLVHCPPSSPVPSPKSQDHEMSPLEQRSGRYSKEGVRERVAKTTVCPSCRGRASLGPVGYDVIS